MRGGPATLSSSLPALDEGGELEWARASLEGFIPAKRIGRRRHRAREGDGSDNGSDSGSSDGNGLLIGLYLTGAWPHELKLKLSLAPGSGEGPRSRSGKTSPPSQELVRWRTRPTVEPSVAAEEEEEEEEEEEREVIKVADGHSRLAHHLETQVAASDDHTRARSELWSPPG